MSNSPSQDVKPDKPNKITLKIQFVDNTDPLILRVKPTTAFAKIFNAVAKHRGVEPDAFRLAYQGENLKRDETTPADMDIGDGEVIDYFVPQIGG